jgi:hypothetical protein
MPNPEYARFGFRIWPPRFLPPLHQRVVEWKRNVEVQGVKVFSGVSRLVWGTDWEFGQQPDWVFNFIVDTLELRGAGHVERQWEPYCRLIEYLHHLRRDDLVWVVTTTFKPRTNAAAGTRTWDVNETPTLRSEAIRMDSPHPLRGVKMEVDWLHTPFPLDGFDFASNDYGVARPLIVQQKRERHIEIVGPSRMYKDVALEWPVFVSHLDEDRADNANGWVPVQGQLYDKKLKTVIAPHATFGRLLRNAGQEMVAQFNVTFDRGEAETASLMPGLRTALGFLKTYPVDAGLLEVARIVERYA